jgi:hypothetical protein
MAEKFSVTELTVLKNGLMQGMLDANQGAELLQMFLVGRGYGVSREAAIDSVTRLEASGCPYELLQRELESLALVM